MDEKNQVILVGSLTRVDGKFDKSGVLSAWGWIMVPHPRHDKYTKVTWWGDNLDPSCLEWQGKRCMVVGGLYWVPRDSDGFDLKVYAQSIELAEPPRAWRENGSVGRPARARQVVRARPRPGRREWNEDDNPPF